MDLAWGIIILALGLIGWLGQLIAWLAPETALRWSLMEAEADVEPTYWADARGEAAWDSLVLWVLPLAGLLLIVGDPNWTVPGLVGGGMYVYFGGRAIFARRSMLGRGLRIGTPSTVRFANVAMPAFGVVGLVTVVAAAMSIWA